MSRIEADIALELEPGELKVGCSDFGPVWDRGSLPYTPGLLHQVSKPYQGLSQGGQRGCALPLGFSGKQVAQGIVLSLLIQWSRVRFPGKPVGGQ